RSTTVSSIEFSLEAVRGAADAVGADTVAKQIACDAPCNCKCDVAECTPGCHRNRSSGESRKAGESTQHTFAPENPRLKIPKKGRTHEVNQQQGPNLGMRPRCCCRERTQPHAKTPACKGTENSPSADDECFFHTRNSKPG